MVDSEVRFDLSYASFQIVLPNYKSSDSLGENMEGRFPANTRLITGFCMSVAIGLSLGVGSIGYGADSDNQAEVSSKVQ